MSLVLVVDDEASMRSAVRMVLERASFMVAEAASGEEALQLIASNPAIKVVLLDIRMPGIDGLQTLARIRTTHQNLPVIMVTGYGSVDATTKAMSLGANHYISKPFKNAELLEGLQKVLGLEEVPVLKALDEEPPSPVSVGPTLRVIAMSLVVLFGIGLGIQHFYRPAPKPVPVPVAAPIPWQRVFTLPYSNPTSLLWHEDKLWVLDWLTQSIYVHVVNGNDLKIIKTYHLPELHVTGMALAGGMLFTCDPWSKKIKKHKLDEFLTVVASYASPGDSPAALYWDGKYLWCTDSGNGKVYQLQPAQKQIVIASYNMPGKSTSGFYRDANYAWTLDSQARRLYQHRLDDSLTVIASYSSEEFDKGPEPLASFSWRNGELWFARDRKGVIYRCLEKDLIRHDANKG